MPRAFRPLGDHPPGSLLTSTYYFQHQMRVRFVRLCGNALYSQSRAKLVSIRELSVAGV